MDDADRAETRAQEILDDAMENVKRYLQRREIEPCGACHYCNDYVTVQRLFCSAECASDYEKMTSRGVK